MERFQRAGNSLLIWVLGTCVRRAPFVTACFVHFSRWMLYFNQNAKIILEQSYQGCRSGKRDSQEGQTECTCRRYPAPQLRHGHRCSWPLTPQTGSSPFWSTPAFLASQEERGWEAPCPFNLPLWPDSAELQV